MKDIGSPILPKRRLEWQKVFSWSLASVSTFALLSVWGSINVSITVAIPLSLLLHSKKTKPVSDFDILPALKEELTALSQTARIPAPELVIHDKNDLIWATDETIFIHPIYKDLESADRQAGFAHELSHVQNKDSKGSYIPAVSSTLLRINAWLVFGAVFASHINWPTAFMVGVASILHGCLQNLLLREREHRADKDALSLMGNRSLIMFLEKLANLEDCENNSDKSSRIIRNLKQHGLSSILISRHPSYKRRIAALNAHYKLIDSNSNITSAKTMPDKFAP